MSKDFFITPYNRNADNAFKELKKALDDYTSIKLKAADNQTEVIEEELEKSLKREMCFEEIRAYISLLEYKIYHYTE